MTGTEGLTSVLVVFSESVAGSGPSGDLALGDLVFNDVSGNNASAIVSFIDSNGNDGTVTVVLDAPLHLADNGIDTISAVPALVGDLAGNPVDGGARPVSSADNTAPFLVSAVTADSDGNGVIDRLCLVVSEPVVDSMAGAGLFSVAGVAGLDFDTGSTPNDASFCLVFNPAPIAGTGFGTSARPQLSHAGGGVVDAGGNPLAAFSNLVTADGAPAAPIEARVGPGTSEVVVVFSEAAFPSPGAFGQPLPLSAFGWGDGSGGGATAVVAATDLFASSTEVALQVDAPVEGSDLVGGDFVTVNGSHVVDGAGNALSDGSLLTAIALVNTDLDGPTPVSCLTRDLDGNGFVDRIEVSYGERVLDATFVLGEFSLSGGGSLTGFDGGAIADDPNVVFDLVDGVVGGGQVPVLAWAASATFTDWAGNAATNGSVACADRVAPVLVSASTVDTNGDGYADGVDTVWSEAVLEDALTATGFNVSGLDGSGVATSLAGVSIAPAGAANDTLVRVLFGDGVFAGDATPTVEAVATGVVDLDGNVAAAGSGPVSAADRVAPVVLRFSLDTVSSRAFVLFSEPVFGSGGVGGVPANVSDLVYTDVSGADGSGLSGVVDDSIASALVEVLIPLVNTGDIEADTIAAAPSLVDAAGNAADPGSSPVVLGAKPDITVDVSSFQVTEGGDLSVRITVSLTARPVSVVRVLIAVNDSSEVSILAPSPPVLVFHPDTYSDAQVF